MVATLNIIIPLISQAIISSVGFVISVGIDGGLSLVYQGLTLLGCGGCGLGGGTIGAVGGGGVCAWIVGTIMGWFSLAMGVLGFGGYGVIDFIIAAVAAIEHLITSGTGWIHVPW